MKPDNYVIGINEKKDNVYLIDYGLSGKYMSGKNHIKFKDNTKLIGTIRYCSINCQKGYEQSRRDDLESLGYCLVYMLKGNLPWQGINDKEYDGKAKVMNIKQSVSAETLCKGLPKELTQYINYCRNMKFEETPSYTQLRKLFQNVFMRLPDLENFQYDWDLLNCKISKDNYKNEHDSNKSNYEDNKESIQPNLSRKIEIRKLSAINVNTPNSKEKPKEEKKEEIIKCNDDEKLSIATKRKEDDSHNNVKIHEIARIKSEGKIKDVISNKDEKCLEHNNIFIKTEIVDDQLCNFEQNEITERDHEKGNEYYKCR